MSRQKSSPRFRFTGAAVLLSGLVFLLPALNPSLKESASGLFLLAVLVPCVMLLGGTLLARMFSLDRLIMNVSLFFCAAGIAALAMSDPRAAAAQALRCGAGLAALLVGGVMIRSLSSSMLTSACTAFLGFLLLAGKLLAPAMDLPVTEAALALLLISFSSLLSRQGPVPAALAGTVSLCLLLAAGEISEALLWGLMLLLLLFAADGRLVILLPSLAGFLLLVFGAFRLFPLASALRSSSSLSALASAGAVGADVLPESLASPEPVSLFHLLAGHYGLIFSGLTVLLFLPFSLRGASVAVASRTRFHAVLAMGVSLSFALRTLASLLSEFGFLPVAGPELPLLTASLPALCSQLFLAGILCGISGRNDADLAEDAHLAMLAK